MMNRLMKAFGLKLGNSRLMDELVTMGLCRFVRVNYLGGRDMKVKVIAGILGVGFIFFASAGCFAAGQHTKSLSAGEQDSQSVEPVKAKKKMATIPQTKEEKLLGLYEKKGAETPPAMARIPSPEGEPTPPPHRKKSPEPSDEMAVIP